MQLTPAQQGVALMEALVALLVLTFGVLSLLWTHQQAAVQQRQQLLRSVAMGIADDLAERMHLNAPQRALYAKTWGQNPSTTADCSARACARTELAAWDVMQLQDKLQHQLPEGDAAVFAVTGASNGWGILIAWQDASESYRTDTAFGTPACPAQKSCWRVLFRPGR
jgi:type IV pilus assembly protein PilV